MPVSTDGVLLGAWATIEYANTILDIGTGTGLLALMCAQRNPHAKINAIDINHEAIVAATHNVELSPWNDRIQLQQIDVSQLIAPKKFEHIICNPPYFNSGEQSRIQQRAIARHTDTLSHQALLIAADKLLSSQGRASFILPTVEGEAFIAQAVSYNWHVSRRCEIQTTATKPVSRLLFELSRQECQIEASQLLIHQQQAYSKAFVRLTQDFYLKM